jgi:GT2 family glycosyltransferase
MTRSVLDLDVRCLPAGLHGLGDSTSALALLRLDGVPIGEADLPVESGTIDGQSLRRAVATVLEASCGQEWVAGFLAANEARRGGAALPSATVAVCTRDRPAHLEQCLEALLRLADDGQEILIVDNCPTSDATRQIVLASARRQPLTRVRYVREDRPGLDAARNRALGEADTEIVAFSDDDAVPDPGWLRALLRNFDHPLVLGVTGLTMPLELETWAQEEFERVSRFGRGFSRIVFDSTTHDPVRAGAIGTGANMAFRRSVLDLVGPFDDALDAGTLTRSGGDYDMFSRVLTAGFRMIYDPAALSWHRHRRTRDELRQTIYGYGVGISAAWTRSLLAGELGVVRAALGWIWYRQFPALPLALLGLTSDTSRELLLAELRGCLTGPFAYFASRWQRRARPSAHPERGSLHAEPATVLTAPVALALQRSGNEGQLERPGVPLRSSLASVSLLQDRLS